MLVVFSFGTLLSILIAAVLALGLDPIVAKLVARGWPRGRAALVVFAALFVAVFALILLTVGPVWDQVEEFLRAVPGYWEELTQKEGFQNLLSTADVNNKIAEVLKDLAAGLPEAADALLGIIGGVAGSLLSLVTLTFLALFLLMERPAITQWLFGFTTPATEARWSPVVEDSIRGVSTSLLGNIAISVVAAPSPASPPGRSGCRSRSCSPSSRACST